MPHRISLHLILPALALAAGCAAEDPDAALSLPYAFDRFKLEATVDITGEAPVIVPVPPPQRRCP
jgi:hypothetical protein